MKYVTYLILGILLVSSSIVFASDENMFTDVQITVLKESFDRNNIIFHQINGPVEFSAIEWEKN